jgi:prophage maintenance system killer protein
MTTRYLDITDVLLIAERLAGVNAGELQRLAPMHRLEAALLGTSAAIDGEERYVTTVQKAAVLCARLLQAPALSSHNLQVAWVSTREFLVRNNAVWRHDLTSASELVQVLRELERGKLSEHEFAGWLEGLVDEVSVPGAAR